MALGNLNYNADYIARRVITTPNGAGTYAPATGIVNWSVRISATPTGAALGALTGTAVEYTTGGFYSLTFNQADLISALTAYLNTVVYIIWSRAGDVDQYYTPVRVVDRTQV
jgi:hypothetical protein